MNYARFSDLIKRAIQDKLGIGYDVELQKITKNNGVVLDGLIIKEIDKNIAPTIYLNPFYKSFMQGKSLQDILKEIISLYRENKDISFKNAQELSDFNAIRDLVAYKLIQREANQSLLKDIPSCEFLDLAVVYYLILDENEGGQMTALIRNPHMAAWGVTKEELHELAMKNTPMLLPPLIRPMREIMRDLLKEQMESFPMEDLADVFDGLGILEYPPLYVLSNEKKIHGAGCILYDGCLKSFAEAQNADVIILPSSLHEVILLPDKGDLDYRQMQETVGLVNKNDVPEEDILSDRVYKYSRQDCKIRLVK
ncbi:hypothetical protein DS742_17460 [Lacrimispora amygdalina]|uniref:DUF1444 family protein n=1 Tax=Lacrimispora amygdalina TaxID=253257 RepID=A0A3E2N9C3_9FIRM|nr:DUF5688 family protein [Clostridium indicum]RFZ77603.1 hypothetical protein DS742_17460 [Clostridium indicum]